MVIAEQVYWKTTAILFYGQNTGFEIIMNHHINHTRPVVFGEVLFDCFPDGSRVLGGAPFNVAWHCQAFWLATFVYISGR